MLIAISIISIMVVIIVPTFIHQNEKIQLDETPIKTDQKFTQITLFPGSRPQEFKLYFKTMLSAVSQLNIQNHSFKVIICVSSKKYLPIINKYLLNYSNLNYQLSFESSITEIKKSNLIIAASGSTTLEAILLNKPLIVLAALPHLSYLIAKYILRIKLPFISLPNFIANEEIIYELIQYKITPNNLLKKIKIILTTSQNNINKYSMVQKKLIKSNKIFLNISKEIHK